MSLAFSDFLKISSSVLLLVSGAYAVGPEEEGTHQTSSQPLKIGLSEDNLNAISAYFKNRLTSDSQIHSIPGLPFPESLNFLSQVQVASPDSHFHHQEVIADYLMALLPYMPALEDLDLATVDLSSGRSAAFLAQHLPLKLESLALNFNSLIPETLKILQPTLERLVYLKNLQINFNEKLGNAGAQLLPSVLTKLSKLETLNLAEIDLGDAEATAIAHTLPQGLRFLYLWNNKIGDAGGEALISNLPATLNVLWIHKNSLGDRSMKALVEKLLNSNLKHVYLHNNQITSQSAAHLGNGLKQSNLEVITLGGTNTIDPAVQEQLKGLPNKTGRKIYVDFEANF